MIELTNVSGGYDGLCLLKDISVRISETGSITTIVGPNGCGKSTLLRMMAGLKQPYEGTVSLQGRDIREYESRELAQVVSFLPQTRDVPRIPAGSLVLHGRFPYVGYPRRYKEEDRRKAREAMEWVGIAHLAERMVSQLSGGERQKVYLAMMLAQETPVVLLDEPTSYLDIGCKFEVLDLAIRMKTEGKTVVLVLHDLDLALTYSDRILVMRGGQMVSDGTPGEIYNRGILESVFDVRVRKVETDQEERYIFRPGL